MSPHSHRPPKGVHPHASPCDGRSPFKVFPPFPARGLHEGGRPVAVSISRRLSHSALQSVPAGLSAPHDAEVVLVHVAARIPIFVRNGGGPQSAKATMCQGALGRSAGRLHELAREVEVHRQAGAGGDASGGRPPRRWWEVRPVDSDRPISPACVGSTDGGPVKRFFLGSVTRRGPPSRSLPPFWWVPEVSVGEGGRQGRPDRSP